LSKNDVIYKSGTIVNRSEVHGNNQFSHEISTIIKTAIQEFSLAYPSWYMSRCTMLYKYGERANNVFEAFLF